MGAVFSAMSFSRSPPISLSCWHSLSAATLSSGILALNIKSYKYVFWKSIAQHICFSVRFIKVYHGYLFDQDAKKKKNVCLVCPMFILIYLSMWWSTERTYCCAFFLNCMARVLFGFGICQLIFPKVIISWSSYSDVTNRGWWGERMITWAQYS